MVVWNKAWNRKAVHNQWRVAVTFYFRVDLHYHVLILSNDKRSRDSSSQYRTRLWGGGPGSIPGKG
jgi:hypothetical protein